ncbi:MAG: restriction endonuclease subunit S [Pseudonocardiaceae bacterium]
MRWHTDTLGSVVTDAKLGFACGEQAEAGVFQIRMNNITKDGTLDLSKIRRIPRSIRNWENFQLRAGDVLFNATNSPELVGKTAVFEDCGEPTVFSNHFVRIRSDTKCLDSKFLARWLQLQFQKQVFQNMCRRWVNQATVGRDALLELKIPLPPLAEQRLIAKILERADALRTKRRETLARLDGLTQAIFIDMFGHPVSNPYGIPLTRLGEVGRLDRGVSKHRPRNASDLLGGPYPLVQTGEVANCDGYIRSYTQTYSDRGLRQSRMWPAGTLCVTIAANIAKTGILTFDACFPDSVVGFTSENSATVEFVRSWLSFLQGSLEDNAPKSAQRNINLAILRSLEVPLPSVELRQEFAQRVTGVERLKVSHRAHLAELDALFASLQYRAFRGEL